MKSSLTIWPVRPSRRRPMAENENPHQPRPSVVIIGLGNPYRHDDAVGHRLAERLREETNGAVPVRTESGEGTALMEAWRGFETAILVDAVYSGADPGT